VPEFHRHCGWSTYRVSFGAKAGSTFSTCAGGVLEPSLKEREKFRTTRIQIRK
jgi:hypothetical protein